MDIRQCRRCRKLFEFRSNPNCPACVQQMDEIFVKVRNFLYDNPRASLEEICEHSGAEEDDVLVWLREGRLIVDAEMPPLLTCVNCRKPIQSGQYCEACANQVREQLEQGARQMGTSPQGPARTPPTPTSGRGGMHAGGRKR